jgi:hypothetical protein
MEQMTGKSCAGMAEFVRSQGSVAGIQLARADVVLPAREFLRDADFPLRAAQSLGVTPAVRRQDLRAFPGSVARG